MLSLDPEAGYDQYLSFNQFQYKINSVCTNQAISRIQ